MRMAISFVLIVVCLLLISSCDSEDEPAASPRERSVAAGPVAPSKPLYTFPIQHADGSTGTLASFQGKVLLLVNVASHCGYTKQYAGLQALHEKYRDRGLAVLAFPANNFGGQEPGTNEQILQFCSTAYGITFPVFAKISVQGGDSHPLYQFLTSPGHNPRFGGDITWNFSKFLISRNGDVIGRYEPPVEPFHERLVADIENALQDAE